MRIGIFKCKVRNIEQENDQDKKVDIKFNLRQETENQISKVATGKYKYNKETLCNFSDKLPAVQNDFALLNRKIYSYQRTKRHYTDSVFAVGEP